MPIARLPMVWHHWSCTKEITNSFLEAAKYWINNQKAACYDPIQFFPVGYKKQDAPFLWTIGWELLHWPLLIHNQLIF